MPELRMTRHRMAVLRATTECTDAGERIYNFDGEAWDRATGVKVSAVVNYLLTRGVLCAQRLEERNGKTVVKYRPTTDGWALINKETKSSD